MNFKKFSVPSPINNVIVTFPTLRMFSAQFITLLHYARHIWRQRVLTPLYNQVLVKQVSHAGHPCHHYLPWQPGGEYVATAPPWPRVLCRVSTWLLQDHHNYKAENKTIYLNCYFFNLLEDETVPAMKINIKKPPNKSKRTNTRLCIFNVRKVILKTKFIKLTKKYYTQNCVHTYMTTFTQGNYNRCTHKSGQETNAYIILLRK